LNVFSGTSVGTVVTTVSANDVDTNPALTYSIVEQETDTFSVDRFSGRVLLKKSLDAEERREYLLHVAASDTAHVARTTLVLRVNDDNDNSPVFQQTSYSALLPGGSSSGYIN